MLKDEIEKALIKLHNFVSELTLNRKISQKDYDEATDRQITQALTRILELVEKEYNKGFCAGLNANISSSSNPKSNGE